MGSAENKQLARRFVDAISRGDVDAIQRSFADDGTVWTLGTMPISGTFTKDQVAAASHRVLDLFPKGLAITITVLAFNLLGDGLRDALDPRLNR